MKMAIGYQLGLPEFDKYIYSDDYEPCIRGGVHNGHHPALSRHHQPFHGDPQDPQQVQPLGLNWFGGILSAVLAPNFRFY